MWLPRRQTGVMMAAEGVLLCRTEPVSLCEYASVRSCRHQTLPGSSEGGKCGRAASETATCYKRVVHSAHSAQSKLAEAPLHYVCVSKACRRAATLPLTLTLGTISAQGAVPPATSSAYPSGRATTGGLACCGASEIRGCAMLDVPTAV